MKLILIRLLKQLNNIKLYIRLDVPTLNNDHETNKIRDQMQKRHVWGALLCRY
jgi:hypothetical protein